MEYNINQLAMITGYTTRSLRSFIKDGSLNGEKVDGVWMFTEEDISAFLNAPVVRMGLSSKQQSLVYDFLADTDKKVNRICVVLDFPVSDEEAREVMEFFSQEINNHCHDCAFKYLKEGKISRFVLSGVEDEVSALMSAYYSR